MLSTNSGDPNLYLKLTNAINAREARLVALATDEARLIATLPLSVGGKHLKALRQAAQLSQEKFARLIGVTPFWLLTFEKGGVPLYRCRNHTLVLLACALLKLGVRLTKDGWELLPEAKAKGDGG